MQVVSIHGVRYKSYREAANFYKLDLKTIKRRCISGLQRWKEWVELKVSSDADKVQLFPYAVGRAKCLQTQKVYVFVTEDFHGFVRTFRYDGAKNNDELQFDLELYDLVTQWEFSAVRSFPTQAEALIHRDKTISRLKKDGNNLYNSPKRGRKAVVLNGQSFSSISEASRLLGIGYKKVRKLNTHVAQ